MSRIRDLLIEVERQAADLPWAASRRWRRSSHVGWSGDRPAVDLHDLNIRLAMQVLDQVLEEAGELDAAAVLWITGRGRRAGGLSPMRRAVLGKLDARAADRPWRVIREGPGRVLLLLDPERAVTRLGWLFWLVVILAALGLIAAALG